MSDTTRTEIGEALRWALDTTVNASMASADWLATDIDPSVSSAVELLTDRNVPIPHLRRAKDAFKTLRIVGETSADRRLGARLYAAAIAAALVWHGQRISRQSDAALERAFRRLIDDLDVPAKVRDLAGQAICVLHEMP